MGRRRRPNFFPLLPPPKAPFPRRATEIPPKAGISRVYIYKQLYLFTVERSFWTFSEVKITILKYMKINSSLIWYETCLLETHLCFKCRPCMREKPSALKMVDFLLWIISSILYLLLFLFYYISVNGFFLVLSAMIDFIN